MRQQVKAFISASVAATVFAVSQVGAQDIVVELEPSVQSEAGSACVFKYRANGSAQQMLQLDLNPPCMFANPMATYASPESESVAVGDVKKAAAWRFRNGVLVIPIIGDPIPDEWSERDLVQRRKDQGLTCGASLQGVLVTSEGVRLSTKRERVGLFCKELGVNAKEAWLLANPQ